MRVTRESFKQLAGRFGRLGWKLALRYTLTTVACLLVLELLLLALLLGIFRLSTVIPASYERAIAGEAERVLPTYFSGGRADLEGIHQWLEGVRKEGLILQDGRQSVKLAPEDFRPGSTQLWILDRAGQVLGQLGQAAPPAGRLPLDRERVPGIEELLPAALAGEVRTHSLFEPPARRQQVVAVPIKRPGEEPAGVALLLVSRQGSTLPFGGVLLALGASLLVFTLGSGLIGTVFGLVTARSLSRRLERMAATAAAWGAGNLTGRIVDPATDEIGTLGRQLNRMAVQLEELLQHRERLSAVEERNRLARELHDSVKQHVFAISMNLEAARTLWEEEPARARDRLDAAFDLARQSQQELTAIIQTLRPLQLEDKGLQRALRDYLDRWQPQSGIEATYVVRGEQALPLPVEADLFRVSQEALANVTRHSGATAVHVDLAITPECAVLEIRDNGKGFDTERRGPGVGLLSMRERMEAAGGTLTVRSGPDGTILTARVPLAGADRG